MSDVVVVGAGVVGLAAALQLRERGFAVEVVAAHGPMQGVSGVAGAIWYPFLAEPRERVLGWSRRTFARLSALAADPASGVVLQPVVELFTGPAATPWWAEAAGPIAWLPPSAVPPPYRAALRVEVPVCDVPRHLPWLLHTAGARGVRFTWTRLASLDEAFTRAPAVVNCTGLAAAALCGDAELKPVRGQVLTVARVPGVGALIDDSEPQPFYVIPRGDELVLGGTAQAGDDRLEVDPADTAAILAGIARRVPALRDPQLRAVRVGLRPWRRTVRLERIDLAGGRRLVHDYGHGGSGFTLAWGCAEEVAALLGG